MVLKLLGSVVLLSSLTAFAVEEQECAQDAPSVADQLAQHVQGCPDADYLKSICDNVGELVLEKEANGNKYRYQTLFKKAACVDASDSTANANKKMQEMWNQVGRNVVCSSLGFNVNNGNLIKYAISNKADVFIYEISKKWKVNLNRVDPTDNRTALDYAYDELKKEKDANSSLVPKIETYIRLLEQGGAKKSADL